MSHKPKGKNRHSENKNISERKAYNKKSNTAPDITDTDAKNKTKPDNYTEAPGDEVQGVPAGSDRRHQIPIGDEKLAILKVIGVVCSIVAAFVLIGTIVYHYGKLSSDLAHQTQALIKIEQSSNDQKDYLVKIDKRVLSIETKLQIFGQIDHSSPTIQKSLTVIKSDFDILKKNTENDLIKNQRWVELQLNKLENRVDSLYAIHYQNSNKTEPYKTQ